MDQISRSSTVGPFDQPTFTPREPDNVIRNVDFLRQSKLQVQSFEDVRTAADGVRDSLLFIEESTRDFEIFRRTVDGVADAFAGSATDALAGFIDGTQSASRAFSNFARGLLRDLARIISQMLVLKAVQTAIGFFAAPAPTPATTSAGQVLVPENPNFAAQQASIAEARSTYLGIPQFARGGIARGPSSGYLAELHGTEAVIPLGANRRVPVSLEGGGSTVNYYYVIQAIDTQSAQEVIERGLPGAREVAASVVLQEFRRQGVA